VGGRNQMRPRHIGATRDAVVQSPSICWFLGASTNFALFLPPPLPTRRAQLRVGPFDGMVGRGELGSTALILKAIPGVQVSSGSPGTMISGSAAVRSVLEHWKQPHWRGANERIYSPRQLVRRDGHARLRLGKCIREPAACRPCLKEQEAS
jgi:hypothetical protein